METNLPDGLYRVEVFPICAGFIARNGRVIRCAPILRRRLGYWMRWSKRVGLVRGCRQPAVNTSAS